jgi:hypothetical protein
VTDPSIDDYVGMTWDDPGVEELAQCVLSHFMGLSYEDIAQAYEDSTFSAPTEDVFTFAAQFEGYVMEAVQQFLANNIERFKEENGGG